MGRTFYYITSPMYTNVQQGGPQNSTNLNLPVTDITTENFGTNPGEIQFYAMGGGATFANGVVNQTVTQITQTGMDSQHHILGGAQNVQF